MGDIYMCLIWIYILRILKFQTACIINEYTSEGNKIINHVVMREREREKREERE